MSSVSDELITQFLNVTGSDDPSRATSYLEMSGGNLETAVGLYMEHSNSFPSTSAAPPEVSTSNSSASTHHDPDYVRPADEVQTMRLMDFEEPQHPAVSMMFPPTSGHNPFFDAREVVNAAAAAAPDSNDDNNDDEEEKDEEMETPAAAAMKTLNDMFAPPTHLMHRAGGFQGARNVAKDARRWLLVNLQRDEDFACHALNRDVWRDELVENLVREGFIFWQQMDSTSDGMTYVQRYKVEAYPHIGILDPRTGRLMWKKEGWTQVNPMTAEAFAQIAADFCSHHTFDKPPTVTRKSATKSSPRPKRPIHELSEEKQLQAAIRASLVGDSDDEGVDYAGDMEGTESDEEDNDECEEDKVMISEQPKSLEEELKEMVVGDEPKQGARVQIRMPDGGRVVRRFKEEDSVKIIYAFVAQSNNEAKGGKPFELRAGFPPKDLFSSMDDTIKNCSLSGESITVRWKLVE